MSGPSTETLLRAANRPDQPSRTHVYDSSARSCTLSTPLGSQAFTSAAAPTYQAPGPSAPPSGLEPPSTASLDTLQSSPSPRHDLSMEPMIPDVSTAGPMRKKFAAPPVKNACLACRGSRTRCNGDKPCASCRAKNRDCEYLPSRRGGPRVRKKARTVPDTQGLPIGKTEEVPFSSQYPIPLAEQTLVNGMWWTNHDEALFLESYIDPGAGLKQLADKYKSSDAIFEELFQQPINAAPAVPIPTVRMVRNYGLDYSTILNAYYIWIHPYFPILPPPRAAPWAETITPLFNYQNDDFEFIEPPSPIALALSAILALIPCPQDSTPLDPDSVRFRRNYSQLLAKSALESIENASDRPESELDPAKALDDADDASFRQQFHPEVPFELETTIALDLLSIYEYAQRGNLKKMSLRANAALTQALELNLHTERDHHDGKSEARRRTWWMTYVCISQVSIVSNTPATWENLVPNITTNYPLIISDPEAFNLFIQAQQAILAASKFVMDLSKVRDTGVGFERVFERMRELERRLEPLCVRSESWVLDCPLTQPVDHAERVLAQSLRCVAKIKLNSARIKVHRYCAFFDMAVFSGKHCDLKSLRDESANSPPNPNHLRPCCAGSLEGFPSMPLGDANGIASPPVSTGSTPKATTYLEMHPTLKFPFTTYDSSKLCLRSALNISGAFDLLPYPNPTAHGSPVPLCLGPASPLIAPRTMPAFACCAMQSSYALLMVKSKGQALFANRPAVTADSGPSLEDMLGHLQQGLFSVMMTLENYGSAFEALGGMRDQVREKVGFGPPY